MVTNNQGLCIESMMGLVAKYCLFIKNLFITCLNRTRVHIGKRIRNDGGYLGAGQQIGTELESASRSTGEWQQVNIF